MSVASERERPTPWEFHLDHLRRWLSQYAHEEGLDVEVLWDAVIDLDRGSYEGFRDWVDGEVVPALPDFGRWLSDNRKGGRSPYRELRAMMEKAEELGFLVREKKSRGPKRVHLKTDENAALPICCDLQDGYPYRYLTSPDPEDVTCSYCLRRMRRGAS